jgi:acyl carrier protein
MDIKEQIREKVRQLAKARGFDARNVGDDDILPKTGLLDSGSIVELIVWVESEFAFDIDEDELSIDNFGSIRKMEAYIEEHRG